MPWGNLSEEENRHSSWGSNESKPGSWGCSGWGASETSSNIRCTEYLAWGSSEWGTSVPGPTSWGTNGFGSRSSNSNDWGSSGLGPSKKSEGIVKHRFWCTEGIRTWGGSSYRYDESCPGCRRDRAIGRANTNSGSAAIPLVSMFVGSRPKIAKKSLWDN
jgi:hypothetical protein